MLIGKATKYGAGITLYGDYWDLHNLYETIHFLANGVPFNEQFSNFVLGLAYDIRHAYQGNRKKRIFGYDNIDKISYRGVDILWPFFLVQVGMLRWSAGFHATTREHQANLFRLEACSQQALISYDAEIGAQCFSWLTEFPGLPDNYLLEFISKSTKKYIFESKPGKSRFKQLPEILLNLSPICPEYTKFEAEIRKAAKEQGCKPEDIEIAYDWPDFKW